MTLSFRAIEIAEALICLGSEEITDASVCDIVESNLDRLVEEWYQFSDYADSVLVYCDLEDESLDSLWRDKAELYWLAERNGDGIGFGDQPWANESLGRTVCKFLSAYAKQQGQVDAYRGDDGNVWVMGFEGLEGAA